jgi:xanthine dehydrogenase accessory factor
VFTHDLERLRTPIALDIGAVTPPEIALAILGDVIATRRSRAATNQNKDITCPSPCPT